MQRKTPPLSTTTFPANDAVKRMLAYQIEREMARQGLTRARMAELMGTSRAALNRLLDAENNSVTLQTMLVASNVLGKTLQIFLNDDTLHRSSVGEESRKDNPQIPTLHV